MSGGSWEYQQYFLEEILKTIGQDYAVASNFPVLAELFRELGIKLRGIADDLDSHASSDVIIKDFRQFEKDATVIILILAMKAAPDELFPRGKWATIQAIQERTAGLP